MRPQCRQAVNQAAGRELSNAEIKKIEDRISATMRQLARTDPAWKQSRPTNALSKHPSRPWPISSVRAN